MRWKYMSFGFSIAFVIASKLFEAFISQIRLPYLFTSIDFVEWMPTTEKLFL